MKAASDAGVLIQKEDCSVLDESWNNKDQKRCRARESAI